MKQGDSTDETGWETSDELLLALGEKYTPDILRATHEPRSASEISDELDIPASTCYRRLDKLSELGVLEEGQRIRSNPQGATTVYSRRLKDISVEFDEDQITVTAETVSDSEAKVNELWQELKSD